MLFKMKSIVIQPEQLRGHERTLSVQFAFLGINLQFHRRCTGSGAHFCRRCELDMHVLHSAQAE